MDGLLRAVVLALGLSFAVPANAGWPAPETRIPDPGAPAPGLEPVGETPFGERIDLATGEVDFHQVDITLEGTGPTIRVARTRAAAGAVANDPAAAFADWHLDVPRLATQVLSAASIGLAWRIDATVDAISLARCTRFDAPHARDAAWDGFTLHLDDGERHAVLKRAPSWNLRPGLPGAFPAVTVSDVQLGCLPATRNGEPGEGFLAVAPDGLRYRLDWLLGVATDAGGLQAAMFATRVEDRFGNWVDYAYEGARLQSILASDGREVAFEWSGDRIVRITTHPGSEASRTWRYEYAGDALAFVVLPDGSRWSFDLQEHRSSLTTPSGLAGQFRFGPNARSLIERTWSGPGVEARWNYAYDRPGIVDVVGPGGALVRHRVSTATDALEGKVLRTETYAADGTLLRTERFEYAVEGDHAFVARIGDAMGASNHRVRETRVPVRERVISQQGREFTWRVADDCGNRACFDDFGRPLVVERIGTHARIERTTYADHLGAWVLGQVASITQVDPATGDTIEPLRIDHDPNTALPIRRHVRGLLQETRTYHADGTLASRSDGRDTPAFDTTIRYGGWMRGIPTTVTFPGGVRKRAGVEVDGTIRWVANETGARTCFAYDAAGRRVRTTWPVETEPTRCGDDQWNDTVATFEQSATATPFLEAGHWRHAQRTGNGVRITTYDASWRPVLVEEHDAADVANTRRTTRTTFDAAGRETFRSYPSNLAMPPPTGTTSAYDALGRRIRVEQASELGSLVSTIEYLDDFRIRATDARGHATTIESLRAHDTPDDALPETIVYPEGLHVDIERDAFDQPTRIARRDAGATTTRATRHVHDPHGRLCKILAPDRGATVIGRDSVGNVLWTVAGSTLDDPRACDLAAAFADPRRVDRTWDARNRLATVAFPDGIGNQAHAYTADGLPSRSTAWNTRAGRIVINHYTWNARRLLVSDSLTHPGIDSWHFATTYDRNGHPSVLAYPNGTGVGLVPNALGQPTRLGAYVLGVRWHPDGSLAQFTYGNGIVHTTARNARGLPAHRRDAIGATAHLDERIDYDANGNVAAIRDGTPGAPGDRLLVHDALDRLERAEAPTYGAAAYEYDATDRLASLSIGGPHARMHHFCRDADGRLTNVKTVDCISGPSVIGIEHDAAGNLVRMNGQAFLYDGGSRLRAVEGIEAFEYDAMDRRIRATSPLEAGEILSQYDRAGRLVWQSDHRAGIGLLYLHLGGRLVAVREQPMTGGLAVTRYLHTDVDGTPVAETPHPDGALLRRSAYEPFGLSLEANPRTGVGFRGLLSDARTGLLHGPEGDVHPMLPGFLGACGWRALERFDVHALDAASLLRAPPRSDC